MLRFSLIVCTRGRPLLLARLLQAIALLRYPSFELVVIYDPRDRETEAQLARQAPLAKRGHCAEANLAKARNLGLALAQGDVVAFIDDDSVPEPDWLDRLKAVYDRPGITAAGGFIRDANGVKFQRRVVLIDAFGADYNFALPPDEVPRGSFLSLTGTNFSVRREIALELRGFDENYPYFLEETDFLRRMLQAGGQVGIAEAAEVHHGFSRSALRGRSGAPRGLLTIARSKAYYCRVNGGAEHACGIAQAEARFSARKAWQIASFLLSFRLSPRRAMRLARELRQGLREGATLARQGRALPVFGGDAAPAFTPFAPAPRVPVCVLAGALREAELRQIDALTVAGYAVTVIHAPAGFGHTVLFAEGVWWHKLPFAWRQGAADAMLAEIRRADAYRKFEKILVVSENAALLAAAAASGLPRLSA